LREMQVGDAAAEHQRDRFCLPVQIQGVGGGGHKRSQPERRKWHKIASTQMPQSNGNISMTHWTVWSLITLYQPIRSSFDCRGKY
jgi:hypothetical protein